LTVHREVVIISTMLSEQDKKTLTNLARQYKVRRLLLFGSQVTSTQEARDIDLAVEGLPAKSFFKFYGDLLFSLKKPVDLIDLSSNTKFNRLIQKEGIPVYG